LLRAQYHYGAALHFIHKYVDYKFERYKVLEKNYLKDITADTSQFDITYHASNVSRAVATCLLDFAECMLSEFSFADILTQAKDFDEAIQDSKELKRELDNWLYSKGKKDNWKHVYAWFGKPRNTNRKNKKKPCLHLTDLTIRSLEHDKVLNRLVNYVVFVEAGITFLGIKDHRTRFWHEKLRFCQTLCNIVAIVLYHLQANLSIHAIEYKDKKNVERLLDYLLAKVMDRLVELLKISRKESMNYYRESVTSVLIRTCYLFVLAEKWSLEAIISAQKSLKILAGTVVEYQQAFRLNSPLLNFFVNIPDVINKEEHRRELLSRVRLSIRSKLSLWNNLSLRSKLLLKLKIALEKRGRQRAIATEVIALADVDELASKMYGATYFPVLSRVRYACTHLEASSKLYESYKDSCPKIKYENVQRLIRESQALILLYRQYGAPFHFTPFTLAFSLMHVIDAIGKDMPDFNQEKIHRQLESLRNNTKRFLNQSIEMYSSQASYHDAISDLYYLYDDFNDRELHHGHANQMMSYQLALSMEESLKNGDSGN